jgi:hypothetical protein
MIHYNKKSIANGLLLLAFVVGILLSGCGRTPPEGFWTWSTEDSTEIQAIVDQWKPFFTTQFEDSSYQITYRADTLRITVMADVRNLWMRPHYWPGSFIRTLDSYQMVDSFIPTKDTTVMVRITEHVSGIVRVMADSCTIKIGDTTIGTETYDLYTRYFVYSPDTMLENPYTGISERYLHFAKDTLTGEWQFKKMSGGARLWIPTSQDAPYLGLCSLRTRTNSVGVQERPDTAHYGIQRLYELDSIVKFGENDTFNIRISLFDPPISYGFIHYNNKRYDLTITTAVTTPPTVRPLPLEEGWRQLMVELAPWEALCKRGNYNAILWVLPMKIVP